MSMHNSFVATYANGNLAKADIARLESAGFDMSHMTVIAKSPLFLSSEMEGMKLLNSLGDLDATLINCIPEGDIVDYETELQSGRFILVAHGTADEIERVKYLADAAHPLSWSGVAEATIYYGCTD